MLLFPHINKGEKLIKKYGGNNKNIFPSTCSYVNITRLLEEAASILCGFPLKRGMIKLNRKY